MNRRAGWGWGWGGGEDPPPMTLHFHLSQIWPFISESIVLSAGKIENIYPWKLIINANKATPLKYYFAYSSKSSLREIEMCCLYPDTPVSPSQLCYYYIISNLMIIIRHELGEIIIYKLDLLIRLISTFKFTKIIQG